MSSLSGPELLIVVLVIVMLFGASKLPKLARSMGQAQREFKEGLKEGASETVTETKAPPPESPIT